MNRTRSRGWMLFAATLLFLTGAINVLHGITALFAPDYLFVSGGQTFFFSLTPWGVLLGVWGLLLLVAGFALATRQSWARTLAVVLLAINVVAQLAFFAANPLWTLTVVAIDLLAIYGLTAGWSSATAVEEERGSEHEAESSYRSGYEAGARETRESLENRESHGASAGRHVPQPSRGEHAR
ncbi:DUF7144 family membrane protein [Thermobifida cellulosilytica]|uniref:DUF7144 domain-containing protein n=1 Tax=Thermobifida cellulosilytica TB100 TaxID=665004 RepID=A0A147KLM9_THECS|nr:hypothetical protein [Thermobifida cellulosilytica]KUP98148.1 hypothetical protein AC529_03140 [Thermobifida cellulosilytica TB100]